jgi:hypothetical protein
MPGLELASDDPRSLARGPLTPGPDERCGAARAKAVKALDDLSSDRHDWEVVTADALLLDSPFPEDELVEDSWLPEREAEVSVAEELVDDAAAVLAAACLAAVIVVVADAPAAAEVVADLAAVTESAGSRPEASCT